LKARPIFEVEDDKKTVLSWFIIQGKSLVSTRTMQLTATNVIVMEKENLVFFFSFSRAKNLI
jgi:hypothetical protein